MKPAWDKLMDAFADSKTALVADVDCTASGKPLCDSNGVQGFPTIKLWPGKDKKNPVDFDGSRDLDGFTAFLKARVSTPIVFPEKTDKKDEL